MEDSKTRITGNMCAAPVLLLYSLFEHQNTLAERSNKNRHLPLTASK